MRICFVEVISHDSKSAVAPCNMCNTAIARYKRYACRLNGSIADSCPFERPPAIATDLTSCRPQRLEGSSDDRDVADGFLTSIRHYVCNTLGEYRRRSHHR